MKKMISQAFLAILIFSCDSTRVFEEFKELDGNWALEKPVVFEVDVDSVNTQYNIDFHVQNELSYPFYNLYFQVQISDPEGRVVTDELKEIILFDPKTGEPMGSGLADSFENSVRIFDSYTFPQKGSYQIQFTQFMRMDTLPSVERVGMRLGFRENPS